MLRCPTCGKLTYVMDFVLCTTLGFSCCKDCVYPKQKVSDEDFSKAVKRVMKRHWNALKKLKG